MQQTEEEQNKVFGHRRPAQSSRALTAGGDLRTRYLPGF
jgi:hypothetical protein